MSRSSFVGSAIFCLLLALFLVLVIFLAGCSNNAVKTTNFPVPATVTLTPTPNVSLEIGANQAFTAGVADGAGRPLTEPLSFQSSNTAIVTVAANGLACAGTWDSLSAPQVCTPGSVGVAQVTATAQGVSSPPTTIYVHQHIDKITVAEIPPPPPGSPPPPGCSSVGQADQARYFAATAFSRGIDITSSVGVFTWQTFPTGVATTSTTVTGLLPSQIQLTAKVPGLTSLFATVGGTSSVPVYFETCRVQSISLEVTSSTGTSKTIKPFVYDSAGQLINRVQVDAVPLTWSSSQPASATVSTTGGVTAAATPGTSTIIASCTPPTCNIGFYNPSLPIYPENVVTMTAAGTAKSGTVFVSSTSCGTTEVCFSTVVPLTTPANTQGKFLTLPATPNSMVFDRKGTNAYIGTNSGLLGSVGLAVLDAAAGTVSSFKSAPGKVLAVSPDGTKIIISDTAPADGPNRVFVFDATSKTAVTFQITGATAADFSPDSLKAFIAAGSTLYVYSKLDALHTIPLTTPASDLSFLPEGAFAYVAGGAPSSVTVYRTCDSGLADTIPLPAVPSFIKTLPDATKVLALTSPTLDIINVSFPVPPSGCSPAVTDSVSTYNLGAFVAKQLIVSQDGSTAYIVPSNLGQILVFNLSGQTFTGITLAGNASPLAASLTPDGSLLYVGASDQTLHIVDTRLGSDIQQISFSPASLCQDSVGNPFPVTCYPDLVAVKP